MIDLDTEARVGPAVVAVGGGHGLAVTLRAAREYAGSITAVVSVADDGGSSGRLRAADAGLPAPGDLRRCLAALAADDSVLGRALEHRFGRGELAGHPLGNLLIAGLASHQGDFVAALDEVGDLVGAVGRVLPATAEPVTLVAELADGSRAEGQVAVQGSRGIARLGFEPPDPPSPAAVEEAILGADQVVMGPGSLFTSVLAAATVPAVRRALARTTAVRVWIANLWPQVPETEGFSVADQFAALRAHDVPVDAVVGTAEDLADLPADGGPRRVAGPVADEAGTGHDPALLAKLLHGLHPRP